MKNRQDAFVSLSRYIHIESLPTSSWKAFINGYLSSLDLKDCIDYGCTCFFNVLPYWYRVRPDDRRPLSAVERVVGWLAGRLQAEELFGQTSALKKVEEEMDSFCDGSDISRPFTSAMHVIEVASEITYASEITCLKSLNKYKGVVSVYDCVSLAVSTAVKAADDADAEKHWQIEKLVDVLGRQVA